MIRTLTAFSAETVSESIRKVTKKGLFEVYVSGGGAHNPLLVKMIKEALGITTLASTDVLGISGDAKEAILFAVLANEAVAGSITDFGRRAKIPSITMGKVSFPA